MRLGMVIDLNRCIGCHACTVACKMENGTGPKIFWNKVYVYELGKYPEVKREYIPRTCMHCENPPCVEVCPTGATNKLRNGIVAINQNKCVGCKACILACPFGARYFNEGAKYFLTGDRWNEGNEIEHHIGTVEKCTFCNHLLSKGQEPACVTACPTHARVFGDLHDEDSEVSIILKKHDHIQMNKGLRLNPSVYYLQSKTIKFEGIDF